MEPKRPRRRPLASLPKAELHIHLEGAMRRSTLLALCAKHGLPVPPDTRGRCFDKGGFSDFIDLYVAACDCLRDSDDVRRLVLEVAQDAAECGATWIEPALSISLYAHRFGGVEATLKVLMEAAEAAEDETGVGMGFIVAAERHMPVSDAQGLAEIVHRVTATSDQGGSRTLRIHGRRGVVGFGLHGAEEGYPPRPFVNAFDVACSDENGVVSVPHAGEIAPSPGEGARSVVDACTLLKAQRIAHGVLVADDEAAMRQLVEANVCLDVCVTSNYLLNVVPDVSRHPLRTLLERGVTCTINSDDPLLLGCSLLSEYEVCREELGLDDEALAACATASFRHSCAPDDVVQKGIAGISKWLADDA